MLLDKQLTFSDQQSLAVAAGAVLSTNTVDLRPTGTNPAGNNTVVPGATAGVTLTPINDVARGQQLEPLVQITEAFASGGAATLTVEIITADDAALTTNVTSRATTGALALATLILGRQLNLAIPPGVTQRYMGMRYTIAAAAMTSGRITAGLVVNRQTNYV
jgi:hypothetical protein